MILIKIKDYLICGALYHRKKICKLNQTRRLEKLIKYSMIIVILKFSQLTY